MLEINPSNENLGCDRYLPIGTRTLKHIIVFMADYSRYTQIPMVFLMFIQKQIIKCLLVKSPVYQCFVVVQ